MQNVSLIRLSKSSIAEAEKRAVVGVLEREFLGMGAEVQQFEKKLSAFFGRPAVCVVNGTAALQLAVQALNLENAAEVLVPSLTYVSSFQAISATGAKPIACDIDPKSLLLCLKDAELKITDNTRAIMPVHYNGGVNNLEEVYSFAQRYKLRVIEDAAHAFGTTYKYRPVGGFGDIACFSFDGIKNITAGEGGCIVTDDEIVLQFVRDARLLGVEKDTENRYLGKRSWEFDVKSQGWRYHMSNIMAAIGLAQLERFDEISSKRQKLAKLYDTLLFGNEEIDILPRDYNTVVPHIYVVRIIGLKFRKELQSKLLDYGIQTGIHYQPNHWLSFYSSLTVEPLIVTDEVFPELLTLPLHTDLTEHDVKYVVNALLKEIKNNSEIKYR
jgi:dTDP-4-amino-4,6-dideoxygalactose transaminase